MDEYFSFGDEAYRKFSSQYIKNKIHNLKSTIISSHSMKIIEETCDEVIVIDKGRIIAIDKPSNAIKVYLGLK